MNLRLFFGGLLLGASALVMGPYGCSNPVTPPSTTTCASDADCEKDKEVCDVGLKKCFKNCKAEGFAGCDSGNSCDETLKHCVCDKTTCEGLADSGCHPVTNICATHCADDAACTTKDEKCIGGAGKKFCQLPGAAECDPAETKDDKNQKCVDKDPAKPFCDPATQKCMAAPGCLKDADCKAGEEYCDSPDGVAKGKCVVKCKDNTACTDATKPKCDKDGTGKCVQCLKNEDCTDPTKTTCDPTFVCIAPATCTDTATCYATNPHTYCGDLSKPCEAAKVDGCEISYDGQNSAWTDGIKNKQGSIIWGAKAGVRFTDTTGQSCVDKDGNAIPNGMLPITFRYYNPGGNFSTCYKCLKWGDGKITNEAPTEQWKKTGDGTSGTAEFVLCRTSDDPIEFVVWEGESTSTTNPSNATCTQ